MKALQRYLTRLRKFLIIDPDRRQLYLLHPATDFTRNSPLTFRRTVTLILGLMRRSLSVELFHVFTAWGRLPVTKSALVQRRKLIQPAYFRDLFQLSATAFYRCFAQHRRWRDRLLLAVDGTGQTLPNEPQVAEAFGRHLNQHRGVASTRILSTFDLLNKVIYRADFHSQKKSEHLVAYTNVAELPKKAIYIYDRGFGGYGLPWLHRRHGSDCLIRMPVDRSNDVKEFVASTDTDRLITINLGRRAYHSLTKLQLEPILHDPVKVRLIKVVLPTGEVEVLLTTLLNKTKFTPEDLSDLYRMRWGVETSFAVLKSFLQLALCSAYTQPGVEQDLYASFIFFNQQSVLIHAVDDEVKQKTKHRQYRYQVNRNVSAGILKHWLMYFYTDAKRTWRARTQTLCDAFIRYLEPYRERPDRERNRRIMRGQDRHIFEYNYRSAF